VAGLHTALRLTEAGKTDIQLYEGRGFVGGRIKTTKDKDGNPLYNDFAWRVGETNTQMLALAKELGVELEEQFTPDNTGHKGSHSDGGVDKPHPVPRETPQGRAPLSAYATHCLASTNGADEMDRESGCVRESVRMRRCTFDMFNNEPLHIHTHTHVATPAALPRSPSLGRPTAP
jgi:uncharacterized protein with NAD-binding domain and iron-sulfur cluster